jgi:ABC transporter permease; gliding motility-associated protein
MIAIFRKELTLFFSTLTGYMSGGLFLLLSALFLWLLPGWGNVFETYTASLTPLFTMSPWLFLILVPAVTMRMFAEERREGTLELLASRPVSIAGIVLGKYFASVVLVLLILIPTLVFAFMLNRYVAAASSIDVGATLGSYFGLLLLGAVYAAIGLFASTLTSNSLVAFLLGVLICVVVYVGFSELALLFVGDVQYALNWLGIEEHYRSIRRGVIDTRDVLYFLSIVFVFLYCSVAILKARRR